MWGLTLLFVGHPKKHNTGEIWFAERYRLHYFLLIRCKNTWHFDVICWDIGEPNNFYSS